MADELAFESGAEARDTPEKEVRRWQLEIDLSSKREKDWREAAVKIIEKYRGSVRRKNSFNILWANTETLKPAMYNSVPKPDVRRRFRQSDMLGKAVAEVMERGLSYCVDAYDLDACLKASVLDSLLPGRGVDRVRYVAAITAGKASDGTREEVEYEQAYCDHVQWDDYRQGAGKTWEEIQWTAFRHKLRRDDLIERFGEDIGKKIVLDSVEEQSVENNHANADLGEVFKRADLWEIWDREGKRVFFVNASYKDGLIFPLDSPTGEPPLKLKGFFPVPRPLQMIDDTGNLIPIPPYSLYEEQAQELDRISGRINKLINACRVRAMYDSTLSELAELMKADDNDLVPVQQARAWMSNGGMEKAIWWMPVEQIAKVLKELYLARESAKQVIYELTGISDIRRGQADPNETLGAQKLKADFSNLRLSAQQKEVQRYARDLIRLLAEVIGERFAPQTLAQMTGLNFPTTEQKQQIQLQAKVMQQQGQPVPQPIENALKMPTWDEVMAVLKSDMQREFRVDIETNSTVAESLAQDMAGLKEVLTGLVEFWQGVGPAVQAQAISMEAVKAISMTIVRRARMGLEVEDALETGLQQPKPQAVPGQEPDHSVEIEQARVEREKVVQSADIERDRLQKQHDEQMEVLKTQHAEAVRKMEIDSKEAYDRWKTEQDNATKITIAEIAADASLIAAASSSADGDGEASAGGEPSSEGAQPAKRGGSKPIERFIEALMARVTPMLDAQTQSITQHGSMMDEQGQMMAHVIDYLNAPKTAERDAQGRMKRLIPKMTTQGPLARPRDITPDASGRMGMMN